MKPYTHIKKVLLQQEDCISYISEQLKKKKKQLACSQKILIYFFLVGMKKAMPSLKGISVVPYKARYIF
jgi:hypothetical protein